jgi:hypothetical protein
VQDAATGSFGDVRPGSPPPSSPPPSLPPPSLPPQRWRVRVRRGLRWMKRRAARIVARPLPEWPGPVPGAPGGPPVLVRGLDAVELRAASLGRLRAYLHELELSASTRGLDLSLADWQRPWQGWSGRLGPLPGLLHHEIRLPDGAAGAALVRVRLAEPVPLWRILAAVLAVLEPRRPLPVPAGVDIVAASRPPWLRPDTALLDPAGVPATDDVIRPYDVWLAAHPPTASARFAPTLATSASGFAAPGGEQAVVVDATGVTARGRQEYGPDLAHGCLTFAGSGDAYWWQIGAGRSGIAVAGRIGDPLDEAQLAVLRRLRAVVVPDDRADAPVAATPGAPVDRHLTPAAEVPRHVTPAVEVPVAARAAALAQLAMTGLVVQVPQPAEAVRALLTEELAMLLSAPLPDGSADPLDWEMRSVAQRRAAVRGHAATLALPRRLPEYASVSRPPTVTALLVTRRPHLVVDAVAALAAQTYPELEIVIGLHGCELPAADRDRCTGHRLPVRVVPIPAERSFGEALGLATRCASGSLLTKVDDDDRYGPEHVWDLVLARLSSGATVVGKGAEFVYLAPYDVTVRRWMGSELYTDVVAGGTILLSRGDLEEVGGWRPVARSVDRGLLDRVLRAGGLVYRTHGLGFVYVRRPDGHTWDPGLRYFMYDPRRQWRGLPPYREFGAP